MQSQPPNDAHVLALNALVATLADQRLADRFLSLTGLSAPDLKQRAGDRAFLAGFLRFLEGHEPDLVAIAEAMSVKPEQLVAAREALER